LQTPKTSSRAPAAHQAGNLPQAEFLYKLVLQADRKKFDALNMLAFLRAGAATFPQPIGEQMG
jgi:hypothetical protein